MGRSCEPRNRALADVVTPGNAALHLARFEALAGLFLLVGSEDRLAAKFDAPLLGVGSAVRGALQNAAAFQLGGNAENGKDDLGKVGCGVEVWFGQ